MPGHAPTRPRTRPNAAGIPSASPRTPEDSARLRAGFSFTLKWAILGRFKPRLPALRYSGTTRTKTGGARAILRGLESNSQGLRNRRINPYEPGKARKPPAGTPENRRKPPWKGKPPRMCGGIPMNSLKVESRKVESRSAKRRKSQAAKRPRYRRFRLRPKSAGAGRASPRTSPPRPPGSGAGVSNPS